MKIVPYNFLKLALQNRQKSDYLPDLLLVINSILLGIWAVKHTIALRNILLVFGVFISVAIIRREFISGNKRLRVGLRYAAPIIFVFSMFLWILSHLFFITLYPELQYSELKSTWLRAFFAFINGLAIGLVVCKNIKKINLLWLGMLASFLVLYCQYIPKALNTFRMYQYDPYGYIFHLKINGVLIGSILIAGLGGLTLDLLRRDLYSKSKMQVFFCLGSIFLTLFAYVFIFDSRNGIGVAAFLFLFWACLLLKSFVTNLGSHNQSSVVFAPLIGLLLIVLIFGFFLIQQNTYNSGWNTYLEDFLMGLQSDKYLNWRDFNNLGMPIAPSGRVVSASTYERTALIVEGVKIIAQNPLGCGVLTQPFMKMLPSAYPGVVFGGDHATHSAWIEFGLSFGIPGLFFLIGTLVISAINTIKDISKSVAPVMTLSLILGVLIIYLVGEVSTQHGVEILFYFLGLIFVMQLPNISKNKLEKIQKGLVA